MLSSVASLPKPKVDSLPKVFFQRKGESTCHHGTLRLTSHHLIFEFDSSTSASSAPRTQQLPYSLILKATRIPSLRVAAQSGHQSNRIFPITVFQKNFDSYAFAFRTEQDQYAVFDAIKDCTVRSDVSQLYAFYYQPELRDQSAQKLHDGWKVYDFKKEFARQGIGSRTKAWRFTDVNAQYSFCPTYPSHMVIPSRISDTTLNYAAKYRSKARIPALTYLHWANHASITRSSQPMVGLKNARSIQDEKLIEAIFTSHHFADPESMAAKAASEASANAAATAGASTLAVYGATSTNLIIDARPTTNAMANVAKGAGTENMEYYKGCKKSYLGIDNIHVMRDSLNRVTDALRESEPIATFGMRVEALEDASNGTVADGTGSVLKLNPTPVDPTALRKSYWLKHIQSLLEGSMSIVRNIHINSSHVLIHCSDGWDRTSQLAAIAQICLDPYFRTYTGLAVLIEKDWLSFGHKFTDRHGLKGSEKFFTVASKYTYNHNDDDDQEDTDSELDKSSNGNAGGGGFDGQAAANAFWGFTKQLTANFSAATSGSTSGPHRGSHIKETSPVFHQFLDCVWQIMRQFPERFEYGPDYLIEMHRIAQESVYGTFLMDCERERLRPQDEDGRMLSPLPTRTVSAWTHLLSPEVQNKYRNQSYRPELDDRDPKRKGTDMGVLFADPKDVRFFERLFKKAEGDMNAYLDKEIEERRRARERLERAVRGGGSDQSANASSTSLPNVDQGGSEQSTTALGIEPEQAQATIAVVRAGEPDPVLDPLKSASQKLASSSPSEHAQFTSPSPGAVDLTPKGKIDPSKLAYQARKPRVANQPGQGLAASPLGGDQGDASVAGNVSNAADAAANRMKNLLIGGWGRLQEAMASPTTTASDSTNAATSNHQREDPWQTGEAHAHDPLGDVDQPSRQLFQQDSSANHYARATKQPFAASSNSQNPWAAPTDLRAEMESQHYSMRSTFSRNAAEARSTIPTAQHGVSEERMRSPMTAHPTSRSAGDPEATKVESNPTLDRANESKVVSDPLGVL